MDAWGGRPKGNIKKLSTAAGGKGLRESREIQKRAKI